MKKIAFYSLALLALASCHQMNGSGNIIKEKRQTGNFKGISAGGAFDVEVKTGAAISVEIEADDNIVKYIKTEVSNGVLNIETEDGIGFSNAHYKAYITVPTLNLIKSSGASSITLKDGIKNDEKIKVVASGAGKVSGMVDAPEVSADASGAANINLSGRTKNYDAEATGSGNIKSADLQTENTDVRVSGAGNAWVHASVHLKASASGAGNVHYKGGASVEKHESGAGSVREDN